MTLVSQIIKDAYREASLISITATPTDLELAEGLLLLQRFVSSVIGNEQGEQIDTIDIGKNNISRPQGFPYYDQVPDQVNWFVPPNTRLALNLTAPLTVYLDPVPTDGQRFAFYDLSGNLVTNALTVNSNGRNIEGVPSKTFSTNSINRQYIYRDDTGNWSLVNPLAAADEFPFPVDFDDFFVTGLAMRLNPRNSLATDPSTQANYTQAMRKFMARYRQHREVGSELALLRTLGLGWRRRYWTDSNSIATSAFNSGYPFPGRGGLY